MLNCGFNKFFFKFFLDSTLIKCNIKMLTTSFTRLKDECKTKIKVSFVRTNGEKITVLADESESLLDVVINKNIEIDGFGACEGTLSCSTCHLIFKPEDFKKLKSEVSDEELDMLDLAFGVTETSRLCCQVHLTKDLDGIEVYIPETINDARNK